MIGTLYSCKDDPIVPDDNDDGPSVVDTTSTDTTIIDTVVVGNPNATIYEFSVDDYTEEAVQEAMILMDNEDTIKFGPGTFSFQTTLSVDDKDYVVIMGAGREETILDFTDQLVGAEGLKITADNTILANFTVQNAAGDAIKAADCNHFSFINVGTVWTGEASEENGAYGIYPVQCNHLLVEGCYAYGASDAGIYVGQSNYVIVRNSTAERNVAGIEIENTKYADVYNNTATGNTAGLLVFDLPGLSQDGEKCRLFNNVIEDNSYPNFAPSGNIVGIVPPGTGIMMLATKDVEIFDNQIINNNIMGLGVIDYAILGELGDETWPDDYITTPRGIYAHNNTFERTTDCPGSLNDMGQLINIIMFGNTCEIPDVLFTGWTPQAENDADKTCISDNGDIAWSNLNMGSALYGQDKIGNDPTFECQGNSLPEVVIDVPTLD